MTDLNGDLIWQKLIDIDFSTDYEAAAPTAVTLVPGGGALVGVVEAGWGYFCLAQISGTGALVWDRFYKDFDDGVTYSLNEIHKLEILENGDIRLLGEVGGNNSVIALFDPLGEITWSVIVGGVYHGIQEIPGGYVLTGMDKFQGPDQGHTSRVTVLYADAKGEPTSTKSHGGYYNSRATASEEINSLTDSAVGSDGSVYTLGTGLSAEGEPVQGILVMKISSSGDILWRKLYRTKQDSVIEMNTGNTIAVGLDGTIQLAGRAIVTNPELMDDSWEELVHLQIDSSGKVIRGRRYGGEFRSIEIVESFKDARLPFIRGNEGIGWFMAGINGDNDGMTGNSRLYRADGTLNTAGLGTALSASDVKVDDYTSSMVKRSGDDDPFIGAHTLTEQYIGTTQIILTDTTLIQVSQAAP